MRVPPRLISRFRRRCRLRRCQLGCTLGTELLNVLGHRGLDLPPPSRGLVVFTLPLRDVGVTFGVRTPRVRMPDDRPEPRAHGRPAPPQLAVQLPPLFASRALMRRASP